MPGQYKLSDIESTAQTPPPQATEQKPSMLSKIGNMGSDVLQGIGEGALHTTAGVSKLLNKIPAVGKYLAPQEGIDALEKIATPDNQTQSLARTGEQVGEFFLPGPGEAEVMAKGPRLAKLAYQAAKGGAQNKLQGGSFTGGAVGGALGEGVSQAAQKIAPRIAESALNIRRTDKAYKPAGAIGEEALKLEGVRPSTLAENARGRLNQANQELEHVVDASPNRASLEPARTQISEATGKATKQGEAKTVGQLEPMAEHLERNRVTGVPHQGTVSTIPQVNQTVSPRLLLDVKRGFGNEFIHNWNPETMHDVKGTAGRAYHELSSELNRAVPDAQPLNQEIGNLIPIERRANAAELNAPTTQRMFNRIARPTGALVGPIVGGEEGYRHGGAPGAVAGAVAGLALPELLTSPTGQMIMARGLKNFRLPATALKGAALQADRKEEK